MLTRFYSFSGVPSIKRNEPPAGKELIKTKAIENLNAALDVATKDGVKLTNIGANDVYDQNAKLINGVRLEASCDTSFQSSILQILTFY